MGNSPLAFQIRRRPSRQEAASGKPHRSGRQGTDGVQVRAAQSCPTRYAPTGTPPHAVFRLAATVLVASLLQPVPTQAQNILLQPQVKESTGVSQSLFITNRLLAQRLRVASRLIGEGDFSRGLPVLQSVIEELDGSEDAFFSPDESSTSNHLSLKAEARRLIEQLPADGRKNYELQYGAIARTALDDARDSLDIDSLARVSRLYFGTTAGNDAAHYLGDYYFDRAEPLAAALQYQRLRNSRTGRQYEPLLSIKSSICWLQAGMPRQAQQVLLELKQRYPAIGIDIGGRQFAIFANDADALPWLQRITATNFSDHLTNSDNDWLMFRGNPTRTGFTPDASPIGLADWRVRTIPLPDDIDAEDPDEIAMYEQQAQLMMQIEARLKQLKSGTFKNLITIPSAHPVVIGDTVVFRSMSKIKAVDANTGREVWSVVTTNRYIDDLMTSLRNTSGDAGSRLAIQNRAALDMFLAQRAWRDATTGQISSDGRFVYAIDDEGFVNEPPRSNRSQVTIPRTFNKLKAYNIDKHGKLVFGIGGPADETYLPFAGYFFLGPPLPLGNQLYVLAEINEEIRLLALTPKRRENNPRLWEVELLWSQVLATPNRGAQQFPIRRLAGASPSYSNGILVCPTTAGAVVGFDLTRRQLLWGYQYPSRFAEPNSHLPLPFRRAVTTSVDSLVTEEDSGRWIDSNPTIVGEHVLLTPRDSQELHCLELQTGRVLWRRPRGESLYVAGVHDDTVIIAAESHLEALEIATGQPAWDESVEIETPSGRGLHRDGRFHIPLSSGEIATIDPATGRILCRSQTRSGHVPGNLVVVEDRVVSLTEDELVGFVKLESLTNRLETAFSSDAPPDARTLALRGELRLSRGFEQEGLDDLRAALKLLQTEQEAANTPSQDAPDESESETRPGNDNADSDGPDSTTEPNAQSPENPSSPEDTQAEAEKTSENASNPDADSEGDEENPEDEKSAALPPASAALISRVRAQLLEPLLEGLRVDYPKYEQYREEIEELLESDAQRFRYQRIVVDGLLDQGESLSAFEALLQLSNADSHEHLVHVAYDHVVRLDRWVGRRANALWARATGEQKSDMEQLIALHLQRAFDEGRLADARVLISSFPSGVASREAGLVLARELLASGRPAESTQYYLDQLDDPLPQISIPSGLALAQMMLEHRKPHLASAVLGRLEAKWPGSQQVAGRTLGEELAEIREHRLLSRMKTESWPDGAAQVAVRSRALPLTFTTPIQFVGRRGANPDTTYRLSSSRSVISAVDGSGQTLWKFPLEGIRSRRQMQLPNNSVRVTDNLLTFQLNDYFFVLNRNVDSETPELLWEQELTDSSPTNGNARAARRIIVQNGGAQMVISTSGGEAGKLGPSDHSTIIYLRDKTLTAAEATTGRVIWQRHLVPTQTTLMGTARLVGLQMPNTATVTLLDGRDGSLLKTVTLPPHDERYVLSGTKVLLSRVVNLNSEWILFDLATGTTAAKIEMDRNARHTVVDDEQLVLADAKGLLKVVTIETGQIDHEAKIPPEPALQSLFARRTRRHYLIAINKGQNGRANMQLINQMSTSVSVNGQIHAFDRSSFERLWTADVTHQTLDLDQPREIPILVFTARRIQFIQRGFNTVQNRYGALILDLRTGKQLFERSGPVVMEPYQIEPGTDATSLRVEFTKETAAITFDATE